MARRSFPIRTYASAPRIASRDLSPATAGPLRSGGNLHPAGHLSAPKTCPKTRTVRIQHSAERPNPSSASEGGTPNELASTVFPK